MRETDVEVIHFPLRICNSIPSLPESMAGPEDLWLPLARGDGISRADSLQLGPAWPHTRRAAGRFPTACCWEVLSVAHGPPRASCRATAHVFPLPGDGGQPQCSESGRMGRLPAAAHLPSSLPEPGKHPLTMALPAPGDPVRACRTVLRDRMHGVRPGFNS